MTTDSRPGRYAATLRRLKRRGCLLAVGGRVGEATATRAVDRLLGVPGLERRRVVVLAHPDAADHWSHRLPRTTVLDARDDGDLARLRDRLDDVVAAAGASSPAEVRVVVDSLDALADREGARDAIRFARDVAGAVRGVRGLGAVRVRTDDRRLTDRLADVVDGRIELREGDDAGRGSGSGSGAAPESASDPGAGAQQRVHLPGVGTSGWLPL